MGLAIVEITNDLLTEGLFAVCPKCRFYSASIKKNGKVKHVCAVTYPHKNMSCYDTYLDYLKTGTSFYVPESKKEAKAI
jgi:hypothetical protein